MLRRESNHGNETLRRHLQEIAECDVTNLDEVEEVLNHIDKSEWECFITPEEHKELVDTLKEKAYGGKPLEARDTEAYNSFIYTIKTSTREELEYNFFLFEAMYKTVKAGILSEEQHEYLCNKIAKRTTGETFA